MDMSSLCRALSFLSEPDKGRKQQLEDYFYSAPVWLMDSFRVARIDKDVMSIKENTPMGTIFFIGEGAVKAVGYHIYRIAFDFMRFEGLYVTGGTEVMMDLDTYKITLQTVTPCTSVEIPRDRSVEQLRTDICALKQEAKAIEEYLLKQGRNSRVYLFLRSSDCLALLLMDVYQEYEKNGMLQVGSTEQELSDFSGLCVKIVSRTVEKFKDDGWISHQGNKISIGVEQHEMIRGFISGIIEQGNIK